MVRIPYSQQQAILAERAKGRTDRQIEKIVGLPSGTLSRPYSVDLTEVAERCRIERHVAASRERQERFWRAVFREHRNVQGWRPQGDCVRSRPDDRPFRSPPRRRDHCHG